MNRESHSPDVDDVLRQIIQDRMVPDAMGRLKKQHADLTDSRLQEAGIDTRTIIDGLGLNGWSEGPLKTLLRERAARVLNEHAGAVSTEGAVHSLESSGEFTGVVLTGAIRDLLVRRGLIDPSEVIDVNPYNEVNE